MATHLCIALQNAGHTIVEVYSRTLSSASQLVERLNPINDNNSINIPDKIADKPRASVIEEFKDNGSDVYLISVVDDAVKALAEHLCSLAPNSIWVHTAGSLPMDIIPAARSGVFYPMQTFSKNKDVDISKVSLFVESETCEDELMQLARSITSHVYKLDSEGRRNLHLAAVFACNFVNHCYALSEKILEGYGLPFDVMLPLIDETASKVHVLSPRLAQTGPAARRDQNIINKQLELLKDNSSMQQIYKILSQSIQTEL